MMIGKNSLNSERDNSPEHNSGTSPAGATPVTARYGSTQRTRSLWLLAAGDVVVFLIFAVIGRRSHGEEAGLQAVLQVAWTALPFILAWFLVAPFVGAFRHEIVHDPKKIEVKTLQSWIAAWPVGLFLHFLFKQELPTISSLVSFGLVTLISNALFLSLWRFPFALFHKRNMH
jgi:Protein of unknown function (DUF3054).